MPRATCLGILVKIILICPLTQHAGQVNGQVEFLSLVITILITKGEFFCFVLFFDLQLVKTVIEQQLFKAGYTYENR